MLLQTGQATTSATGALERFWVAPRAADLPKLWLRRAATARKPARLSTSNAQAFANHGGKTRKSNDTGQWHSGQNDTAARRHTDPSLPPQTWRTPARQACPLASFLDVKPQEDQPRQRPSAPVAFSLPTNALSKRAEQPKRQDDETLVETPAARPSPEERRHLKWGPPQQRQSARTRKSSCKRRRPALPQKKTL